MKIKTLPFLLVGALALSGCSNRNEQIQIAKNQQGMSEYPYKLLIDTNKDGKVDLVRSYIVLPSAVGTIIYQSKLN